MLDGEVYYHPEFIISVFQNADGWGAMGSRKATQMTIQQQQQHFTGLDTWDFDGPRSYLQHPVEFEFFARTHGFIYVQGTTILGALGTLLDAFQREEKLEVEEEADRKRKQDLARFGGEIDDELVRKIVKWRKKRDREQG